MPATAADWKNQPFVEGIAVLYARDFSPDEFARLREGLVPQVMEDKWFVYFEAPYLYFHRSWTGLPAYRVELAPRGDGATVIEALWDPKTANGNDPVYFAELLDFLVASLLLGERRKLPHPPGKSGPTVTPETGQQRRKPAPKPPWWKFWG